MNTCLSNKVEDPLQQQQLARNGKFSYEWAGSHMAILDKIRIKNEKSKPLAGYKLGFCKLLLFQLDGKS